MGLAVLVLGQVRGPPAMPSLQAGLAVALATLRDPVVATLTLSYPFFDGGFERHVVFVDDEGGLDTDAECSSSHPCWTLRSARQAGAAKSRPGGVASLPAGRTVPR